MNLTLFFRLIVSTLFQKKLRTNYDSLFFYCPTVYAKDGFNVSLQINFGNSCESENGYRRLGHTYKEVEFGFPSENEKMLHEYAKSYPSSIESNIKFDVTGSVGGIPVEVLEKIFEKHGGIDWEKTISIDYFNQQLEK